MGWLKALLPILCDLVRAAVIRQGVNSCTVVDGVGDDKVGLRVEIFRGTGIRRIVCRAGEGRRDWNDGDSVSNKVLYLVRGIYLPTSSVSFRR